MSNSTSRIDILLRLLPEQPSSVIDSLERDPTLASQKDAYGYSLLHAASSYGHVPLMRLLVQTYHVDPNIKDDDEETPLFYAESLDVAKCLVEELHVDVSLKNVDGLTAYEKIAEEGEGSWHSNF